MAGKTAQPKPATAAEEFSVPSLERGMAILELVGDQADGLGVARISTRLGVSLNSVFRITSALELLGYLRRDPETKKFFLAGRLLTLGLKAAHGRRNLVECSHDLLLALRDEVREPVALGVMLREEGMGVVLASVEGLHSFSFQLQVGHRFELYCSAPGKAMLARLPAAEYAKMVSKCVFIRHPGPSYGATLLDGGGNGKWLSWKRAAGGRGNGGLRSRAALVLRSTNVFQPPLERLDGSRYLTGSTA